MRAFLLVLLLFPLLAIAKVEPYDEHSAIKPEPKITIVEDEDKTLQIHEVNGKIYGIKVIPKVGEPYYLVDSNGDGKFVRDNLLDNMLVPEWTLFSW